MHYRNMCEDADKADLAQERATWPTLLNTTINVRVPYNIFRV